MRFFYVFKNTKIGQIYFKIKTLNFSHTKFDEYKIGHIYIEK